MKRLICFILAISMLISFTACFGGGGDTETCTHVDENGDNKCDKCDELIEPDETGGDGEGVLNGDLINIAHVDFTILCDYGNEPEKILANKIVNEIKEKTGVKVALKAHTNTAETEYILQLGTVPSLAETAAVLSSLDEKTTSESDAYAISVKDKVVVVTATDSAVLSLAVDKLLSFISGDKLQVSKDMNEEYIVYAEGDKLVTVKASELAASTLMTSVKIDGVTVGTLNGVGDSYDIYYGQKYPERVDVTTLSPNASAKSASIVDGVRITVTAADGETKKVIRLNFVYMPLNQLNASIVNKNGAEGVVSFVFDDGIAETADILNTVLLPKYQGISVTHAMITKNLATITGDPNGNYQLSPVSFKNNQPYVSKVEGSKYQTTKYTYTKDFWADIIASNDRVEILSHSHTHAGDGFKEALSTELKGSQVILKDYLGLDVASYIKPGGSGISDGITGYMEMLKNGGIYIGARTNSTMTAGYNVNTVNDFKTHANRYMVDSLTATYHGTALSNSVLGSVTTTKTSTKEECLNAGISHWTNYIDAAINEGGWAPFCLHGILTDDIDHGTKAVSEYWAYQSQVDALFAYAQEKVDSGKLWVAKFGEAQKYYNSWSSATVNTDVSFDGGISVSISDNEPDSIYNVALTVRVTVPSDWTDIVATYNGVTEELEIHTDDDGTSFVYVNVVPDKGAAKITKN